MCTSFLFTFKLLHAVKMVNENQNVTCHILLDYNYIRILQKIKRNTLVDCK